jgi:hypothetical protein
MVSVRAGDTWKCQMEMWNVTPKEQKLTILLLFEKKAGQWALGASQPNSADLAAPVKDALPADNRLQLSIWDIVTNHIRILGSTLGNRVDLAETIELQAAGRTRVIGKYANSNR